MVRSLWTAATGMIAQQTNVDNIANNLSNVNTVGYKTQVNEFKSLLYQTLQTRTTSANGEQKPTGAQVGLGVRNASISTIFKDGNMTASESDTAFAITGSGFFAVKGEDGNTYYTRNGNFLWTRASNGGIMLADTDGRPVQDSAGKSIILSNKYETSKISVTSNGEICYPDANNNPKSLGIRIGLYQSRFFVFIGKKRIAVCGEAHFLSMLFQKRGDLQRVYGCIRSEIKGDPAVFALDLRHIQTMGCHTDQGDPKQIIHCLGNIAKTV